MTTPKDHAINNLPKEIILEILQRALCKGSWIPSHDVYNIGVVPEAIVLSSVCSRWHQIVDCTPSLWAILRVDVYTQPDEDRDFWAIGGNYDSVARFAATVAKFLQRSGQSPLDITFGIVECSTCSSPYGDALRRIFEVVELLTQQAHRWKKLTYRGPSRCLNFMLSGLKFPLLTEVDCDFAIFTLQDRPLPEFRVENFNFGHLSQSPLKGFGTSSISLAELKQILRDCSSDLESLAIRCLLNDATDDDDDTNIWPNITSLESWDVASLELLFSSFKFPSLREVVFRGPSGWPTEAFRRFVARIKTLVLRDLLLSDEDLLQILNILPGLHALDIHHYDYGYPEKPCPVTSHLFLSLTLTENDLAQSLVPQLKSLVINSGVQTDFDDRQVVTMVESRWVSPSLERSEAIKKGLGIQSVVLKFTRRHVDLQLYQPLEKLDKQGLRVVVVGKTPGRLTQSDSESADGEDSNTDGRDTQSDSDLGAEGEDTNGRDEWNY